MFNALNRFISRLDGDVPEQRQHEQGTYGFQVLRNTNLDLAVEPWYDFIVGINGRVIESPEPSLFAQEVRNCAGGFVTLGLWNAKGQRTREIHAPVSTDTGSLGLSLQYSPISLAANIWHVLDVPANSPADNAALLPYSDYIIGSPEGALHGESALGELVEDFIGRPLRVYVYNNEYDVTREVTIQPSRDWGGAGALGCTLGYGALHRLPAPLSEPVSAPGETMFDGHNKDKTESPFLPANSTAPSSAAAPAEAAAVAPQAAGAEYLVPAQMVGSSPVSAPPKGGKKKERQGHSPNKLMDDYFKEEEEKSKELDNAPAASKGSALPPPPKATGGGPPKAEPKEEDADGGS